jgi:hypothetical protein
VQHLYDCCSLCRCSHWYQTTELSRLPRRCNRIVTWSRGKKQGHPIEAARRPGCSLMALLAMICVYFPLFYSPLLCSVMSADAQRMLSLFPSTQAAHQLLPAGCWRRNPGPAPKLLERITCQFPRKTCNMPCTLPIGIRRCRRIESLRRHAPRYGPRTWSLLRHSSSNPSRDRRGQITGFLNRHRYYAELGKPGISPNIFPS